MRRWLAASMAVAVLACDAPPASSRPQRAARASGSEERLSRARREMGLERALEGEGAEDAEPLATPFELGDQRLPRLPREVSADQEPLREGLARARAAFAVDRPVPDPSSSRSDFMFWVERSFADWVQERGEALRTARSALEPAERGEVGEYVVASAVIGLLFARFAESIANVPLPASVAAEHGDRLRFRDAFLRAAAPLWDRAADAFGACASATVGADGSLRDWQRYCDQELERAQSAPRPLEE